MPTDLTVILEHRPGELARLAEITGEAGATIHGLAAFTGEGRGVVHILLDDAAVAGCWGRWSALEWGSPTNARSS